jgi:hypothetical protein
VRRSRRPYGKIKSAMRASGVARLVVAGAVVGGTACSIWAALSDPYKNNAMNPDGGEGGAATDTGAREGGPTRVNPGFLPYALAVYGDTVYAVDELQSVHVAFDASTSFSTFWTGDGGEIFYPHVNGIAASAAGVFWTVGAGLHHCAQDGGACGFLRMSTTGPIAASDTVVAWIDSAGVQICTPTGGTCSPTAVAGSKGATLVSVWSNGTVAWTDGGKVIHVGSDTVEVGPVGFAGISTMGIDNSSGTLYWENQFNLGSVQADAGTNLVSYLAAQAYKPDQLFANRDIVYWSLRGGPSFVYYCRVHSDAGCTIRAPLQSNVPGGTMNYGIVADSRRVLAIVSSTDNTPPTSALVVWPVPQ